MLCDALITLAADASREGQKYLELREKRGYSMTFFGSVRTPSLQGCLLEEAAGGTRPESS